MPRSRIQSEGLIDEVRRNLHRPKAEWAGLAATEPLDAAAIVGRLGAALAEAEAFVSRMPSDKLGLLFLRGGEVVQPDRDRLDDYKTHGGRGGGQWPGSPEIAAAMNERQDR